MRHAGWKILAVVAAMGLTGIAFGQPGPRGGRGMGMGMGPMGPGMGPGMAMRGGQGQGMGMGMGQRGPWCPVQGEQVRRGPGARPQLGPAAQPGRRQAAPATGRSGVRPGAQQAFAGRGARGGMRPGRGMAMQGRAAGRGIGAGVPMARGAQWLDLTDGQQDKIKAIVKEAVADRAERRADIAAAIKDVLTEEQAKKIEALQSRRPMRGADRGQGIGRGQRPGWGQGPAQGFGPGQGRGRDFQRQNDQPRPGAWQGQGQGQGRGPGRGAGPRR